MTVYSDIARCLSSRYRVTTYDRRGFSRSNTKEDCSPENVLVRNAQDTAALIQHLSPTSSATLFGTSEAALIAIEMLYTNPSLLKEVILHEPVMVAPVLPSKQKLLTMKYLEIRDKFKKQETAAAL